MATVINVVLHSLLLLVTVRPWLPPVERPPRPDVFLLPVPSEGPPAVPMPYLAPPSGQGSGAGEGVALERRQVVGPAPELVRPQPDLTIEPRVVRSDTGTLAPVRPPPGATPEPRPGMARIGPARGQGTLWVQPLPLAPRALAQRLSRTHLELVDSAVSAIVQAYIDSVVAAPTRPGAALPSWVTEIEGQSFGLDSRYIYLGPLRIPTALLALLPIPGGSNADLQEGRRMMAIREDLAYAVRRAETMDDFKKAIKEIRERRDREREFERNRARRPPVVPPPPDSTRP